MITLTASQPSPYELLSVALRYKKSIMIAFIVPVLVAVALAYLTPKVYQADSKVMVRAGREYVAQPETGDHNAVQPSGTMQEAIDTEVEILTSKDVRREVVESVGIERLYPALAGLEPPNPLMVWLDGLPGVAWAKETVAQLTAPLESPPAGEQSLQNRAIEALSRDLTVKPVKLSNVIEVSVRNRDRAIAGETLNKLLASFRTHHIAAFSRQRSSVLEEQVAQNMAEIADLEKERAEYRNQNRLFAAGEQRTTLIQQRARGVQELSDTRVKAAALQQQVQFLSGQLEKLPPTIQLEVATQPSAGAQSTEKSLQELKAKEGQYATLFNSDSPILTNLRTAIKAHKEVLAKPQTLNATRTGINPVLPSLEIQLMTAKTELTPLSQKESDLATEISRIDEQLRDLSVTELKGLGLDRRIAQLDLATNTLRQRLEDARFLDELDHEHLTSVNVIERAAASDKPVSPRKMLYGLAGIACGCLTAAGAFLIALTFGNRFLSVEMVERVLAVPVVAVLPLMPPRRGRGALALGHQTSARRIAAS